MAEHSSTAPGPLAQSGIVRAAIGLAQGIALYLLFDAFQSKTWPATDGPLFAALVTACVLTPLVAVSSLSYLRLPHLIGWTLATAVICAGLAWYSVTRDPVMVSDTPRNLPSWELGFSLALGLFIAHCLVVAGCIDRRFIARYPTYFDVSWKYGVQAILAALFTLVLWLLLLLGAELFKLIKINLFSQMIQKSWFWIPVTTLSVTYALHTTDVRVGIVRGVRSLSCNLLSWLLPLMALIGAGFLISLPFTGLEPLWSTRRASSILLAAAASLIFLINSAYQDGTRAEDSNARAISPPLRVAMLVASLCLVPLAALSAYGVSLRVGQYGWTPDRVIAMACALVAACYALGYVVAAVRWPTQFRAIEIANVATAFVIVAILLCLLTPIADPARISVASQIGRLTSGKVSPEQFDYRFLRFFAGRYGQDALQKLTQQDPASTAASRAKDAQALRRRHEVEPTRAALTAVERARTITVVQPQGQSLPQSFLETDWRLFPRSYLLPVCLSDTRFKCDAVLADLDGDGTMEVILIPGNVPKISVFGERDQRWTLIGELANRTCAGIREGFKAGTFELTPSPFKDVIVNGERLHLNADNNCQRL